jgi:hypothetical protein
MSSIAQIKIESEIEGVLDLVACGILPANEAATRLGSLYASLRLAATPRPVIEYVLAREWQPSDVARRVMAEVLA